jgi:hypothetical protein
MAMHPSCFCRQPLRKDSDFGSLLRDMSKPVSLSLTLLAISMCKSNKNALRGLASVRIELERHRSLKTKNAEPEALD